MQTEVDDLTEPQQYGESSEVFRFSGEYCPLYLAGAGDSCFYFYQRTDWEDDGHAYWTTEFFRQAYSRDSEPESINISFENPFHTAFFVSAGEWNHFHTFYNAGFKTLEFGNDLLLRHVGFSTIDENMDILTHYFHSSISSR